MSASSAVPSDIEPATTPAAADPRREATLRALVAGVAIGVVLAAGNVYTSIKITIIDGGGVTAALVAFGLFAAFKRSGRSRYGALENNITQTVASSAAVMTFVTGVVAPIPALMMLGSRFPSAAIVLWGAAVGLLGIFIAALVRRRLVVEEGLPFPTGIATGEVIETIFGAHAVARRRIIFLATAAALAAAITWFRDARPALIPQGFMVPGTFAGVAAAALGLGVSCSPLMVATGAMVGVRTAAGMLVGAATARLVLSPWLLHSGIVARPEFGTLNSWLVWPALGLLLAGSFLPLLLDSGAIVRSFRQLWSPKSATRARRRAADPSLSPRLWAPLLVASVGLVLVLGWSVFEINPLVALLAVVISAVLANVAARATGETDFSPGGSVGTIGLVSLARHGTVSAVMGGSLCMGMTSQTSQTLWAFRAGHHLGASPRSQVGAQILGVLVGAVVTVPVYFVIVSTYGLGTEKMPAVSALSWKATAEAMRGLAALPRLGGVAVLVGLGAGVVLTLLGRGRIGRYLPSAGAIGVGFMLPFSLSLPGLAGALLALGAQRSFRRLDQPSILALASGGIAGESIMGVVIAILMAVGAIQPG